MKNTICSLLFACFFLFWSQTFAQQKVKSKSNEPKIKNKEKGFTESKSSLNHGLNNIAANDSSDRKELEHLTIVWKDAILNRDSTILNELVAPEYKLQRYNGSTPIYRATWFDNLYHHLKVSHWEQSDIFAQVYGDVGIVTSLYAWTGTFHDRPFDSKGYLTDMWVRRNNHWQVYSRTNGTFEGSKTLDGK